MIANKVSFSTLLSWRKSLLNGCKVNRLIGSCYSTETTTDNTKSEETVENVQVKSQVEPSTKSTFSKAFDKYTGQESFVKLLRNSTFVRLGEPSGKIVEGVVHHIVEDDLYIDFGGKFDCVCLRPLENGPAYRLGTKVRVLLRDTELSTRFLGASTDLTILEADATLLGLLRESKPEEPPGESITQQLLSPAPSVSIRDILK